MLFGHKRPDGRWVGLVGDIAKVEQFLEDCFSSRGAHRLDIVAGSEGGLASRLCCMELVRAPMPTSKAAFDRAGPPCPRRARRGAVTRFTVLSQSRRVSR